MRRQLSENLRKQQSSRVSNAHVYQQKLSCKGTYRYNLLIRPSVFGERAQNEADLGVRHLAPLSQSRDLMHEVEAAQRMLLQLSAEGLLIGQKKVGQPGPSRDAKSSPSGTVHSSALPSTLPSSQ